MVDIMISNNRDPVDIVFSVPTCLQTNYLDPKIYRAFMDIFHKYGDYGVKIVIDVSPLIVQTKLNF